MGSWNKEEITMFYESYRNQGKDWKKVAADVGTKTIDMVKSFYHLNWAYLSLPSGLTSVAGLIATMERRGIFLVGFE
ncbi:protein ALWAYS EARLY 3-like [Trifolium pratense]|uniref:protein ALWAYS EARLY 3-like n=1 Tax=Trifolium pratense TaxID=57577 RepID=UPI001E69567F|nr:protein ALWAYS EARLY 3-like [Trifolium pratense]